MRLRYLVALSFIALPCFATVPVSIGDLLRRLEQSNSEIYGSKLNSEFQYQNLRGAKSRLWPSLSLSGVAKESADNAFSDSTATSTGASTPDGALSSDSSWGSAGSNLGQAAGSGWSSQVSMSYMAFTGFAVHEDIRRAENGWSSAKISEDYSRDNKRSEFLQILLEWQSLKTIEPVLGSAKEAFARVKRHKNRKSSLLFTTSDRAGLSEKEANLEYHRVRVEEGLILTETALRKMLPDLKSGELESLPKIQVKYALPTPADIKSKYEIQSRSHKQNNLSVDSAKAYNTASEWSKPWVPIISWSASYGQSGDYAGTTVDNGASTSVVATFNLFDGFYTQARVQQSRVALEAAKTRRSIERDKKILYLLHARMQANVARADYTQKLAVAEKIKVKWTDVQRKQKQGIATKLEVSAGGLEYSKAQLDALQAQKKYQQNLLTIAVELNEWEKVTVHEM